MKVHLQLEKEEYTNLSNEAKLKQNNYTIIKTLAEGIDREIKLVWNKTTKQFNAMKIYTRNHQLENKKENNEEEIRSMKILENLNIIGF